MSLDEFNPAELYKQSPPEFGHGMLKYFAFEEGLVYLDAGSYGVLPLPVLHASNELTMRIESNPAGYVRVSYNEQLLDVRRKVAQLLGADLDEIVLVQNSSMGVNTVLRNLVWEEGDTLVTFSTSYPAAVATAQYIADTPPHPQLVQVKANFPMSRADILEKFKDAVVGLKRAEGKKVVAIIDGFHSLPGVYLPWKEMVAICKENDVISVIDAAHSLGHEQDINLSEAAPDFWFSNCHKWLYSKRPSGVLYAPKRNQHLMRSSIPTSFAYVPLAQGKAPDFAGLHNWTSSTDPVHYLSIGFALDFRNWVGGEKKINDYCHDLAIKGGKRLAEVLGTSLMDPTGELTKNMVNVGLPLSPEIKPSAKFNRALNIKLLEERKTACSVYYHNNRWWVRCCAQIFNELSDFEKLGEALPGVCKELTEEFGANE